MAQPKKLLLALGGATGSGKTNLAIQLAKYFPELVILSADSRQIYKYLNIGSAKIGTAAIDYRLTGQPEPVRVAGGKSQYLIDIAEPNTSFTLAEYQAEAYRLMKASWDQDKVPFLVGGTGLYLQAVIEGYVLKGGVNLNLRSELEQLSVAELQKRVATLGQSVGPGDRQNKRRLIRAIERGQENGDSIKLMRRPLTKSVRTFVLDRTWEEQQALAPSMVRERLELGLVEETRILLDNNVDKTWLRSMGLSYRLVIDMLDGKFPPTELEERMIHAFRQLMRRQRTWFNRMPYAEKLTADDIARQFQLILR